MEDKLILFYPCSPLNTNFKKYIIFLSLPNSISFLLSQSYYHSYIIVGLNSKHCLVIIQNLELLLQTDQMNVNQEQTPFPQYQYAINQQTIIDQVLRFSLQFQHQKVYSRAYGLPKHLQKMIKSMKMGRSAQKCTICMEEFLIDQLIKKLPCNHIIHKECAKKYLKINNRCPVCRLNLQQHLLPLYQEMVTRQGKVS